MSPGEDALILTWAGSGLVRSGYFARVLSGKIARGLHENFVSVFRTTDVDLPKNEVLRVATVCAQVTPLA